MRLALLISKAPWYIPIVDIRIRATNIEISLPNDRSNNKLIEIIIVAIMLNSNDGVCIWFFIELELLRKVFLVSS